MTRLEEGEKVIEVDMSLEEVQRAIAFLLKERERVKLQGRRRRQAKREAEPPKEPTVPKKYYVPTGRPRGRPRKTPADDKN
ncbi:hypothetical protein EBT25_11480 [bacterium]|nr:hypothetical protein [bacterium]NDF22653.1 hypothetical protein [Euryarchaeota archaeon]